MLYLFKFGYDENDLFIFSFGIPEEIRVKFNHYYFPETKFQFSQGRLPNIKKSTFSSNSHHIIEILKLRLFIFIKTFNKDVEINGHAHVRYSFPIYECENNSIIEDGLGNYGNLLKPHKFKYPKFARFFGINFKRGFEGYGTHENIKKIYLTKDTYPDIIKDKVEVINPKELWQQKTEEEKQIILDLFNLKEIYHKINDDSVILITQPLSEDNILPYEEEINIYREIIDKYPNLVIKTHPREQKNYNEIFDNVTIIDTPFPFELLKYVGIKFSKIITLYSTVAVNLKDECEIEIYDKKTSSKRVNESIKLIKEKLK